MTPNEKLPNSTAKKKPTLIKTSQTSVMQTEVYHSERYIILVQTILDGLQPAIRFVSQNGCGPDGEILSSDNSVVSFPGGAIPSEQLPEVQKNIDDLIYLIEYFSETKH